jgi:hypothetical protein
MSPGAANATFSETATSIPSPLKVGTVLSLFRTYYATPRFSNDNTLAGSVGTIENHFPAPAGLTSSKHYPPLSHRSRATSERFCVLGFPAERVWELRMGRQRVQGLGTFALAERVVRETPMLRSTIRYRY